MVKVQNATVEEDITNNGYIGGVLSENRNNLHIYLKLYSSHKQFKVVKS